jgi:hypothetical protein
MNHNINYINFRESVLKNDDLSTTRMNEKESIIHNMEINNAAIKCDETKLRDNRVNGNLSLNTVEVNKSSENRTNMNDRFKRAKNKTATSSIDTRDTRDTRDHTFKQERGARSVSPYIKNKVNLLENILKGKI